MHVDIVEYSAEDKKLIRNAYRRLLRSIKLDLSAKDKDAIQRAYKLAVEAHMQQRRKSGEPYVVHPIEVAKITHEEIGLGPTAIVCAILHDVVEDTDVELPEIRAKFGTNVSKIVDGLTKLDGLYNVESPQAENFKKVLSTLVEDVRVVLIKMADRLHNLRTIDPMPRHKQLKIAAETSYIYAPLAHRLGIYNVRTEFQDICMKITEPEVYAEVADKLLETKKDRQKYINDLIRPLKSSFEDLGIKYRIVGRPKSISSIYNKIKKKRVSFDEIYDLFAIRVILDVPKDKEKSICWQVYSLITDVYKPIPERLKDWITTPKSNGYESLHTTVIGPRGKYVEVQIRTERMDDVAERGLAAHWKYKGITNNNDTFETWFDNIRDILETPHNDAIEFLNDFKANLFKDEVYVYTPKGDMRILPKGATALDFAFDIHTDVGYRSTAIKVNNKLVPMGYRLRSGDQVEVITNKNQKPNENWLKMVVTGKARSRIRSAMKEERRKQGELGMEALARKLKNMKVDYEENVDFLVRELGFKSRPDLYYAIAIENFNLVDALKQFKIDGNKFVLPAKESKDNLPQPKVNKKQSLQDAKVLVNGEPAEQYDYSFAKCCNPVPGDDIFSYLTSHSGLKIHRTNCPNATHIMANYSYRVMKAEWGDSSSSNFVVDLQVTGIDDGPGVIQRLTNEISNTLGINIRSFSITGNEGYFEGNISLMVLNKDQLEVVIRSLGKMKGISNVVRVDKVNA